CGGRSPAPPTGWPRDRGKTPSRRIRGPSPRGSPASRAWYCPETTGFWGGGRYRSSSWCSLGTVSLRLGEDYGEYSQQPINAQTQPWSPHFARISSTTVATGLVAST